MKPTRASILSTTEEKFLLNQIAVLRKLQIKSLPDDKILHDFLSCVSPEKTLIAYKDTDSGVKFHGIFQRIYPRLGGFIFRIPGKATNRI